MTDFDRDPEALAWARAKIQRHVDWLANAERETAARGNRVGAIRWRFAKNFMARKLIGGTGCVIADFDERLPETLDRIDKATPTKETP
ncbi:MULTISPECIES: hypothetical protein [Streptomyces]|uniref:Uncharacterized protein n=1 Tax=Streptomyces dengpaensis TaxID=2049881 RepID=A0ABN5IAD0_9ACTN|nr:MULTISPECIES: hypothetical protein [Streptomyces]AVH59964.1 hypothetical protein C4B68_33985 [Streptomyces dengpaensis]PIB09599.1 hypothetical protein B1C81_10660 [Streptomyces sp. HG99]